MTAHEREYQKQWRARNRAKSNANSRHWKETHREEYLQSRRWSHAKQYGLSKEEFDLIADKLDNGPCEICGKAGRMDIDHDHNTNRFRGLLCNNCNRAIGHLQDSPELLRRAADYIVARRQ